MEELANLEQIDLENYKFSKEASSDFSTDYDATSKITGQSFYMLEFNMINADKYGIPELARKITLYPKLKSPTFLQFFGFNIKIDRLSILTEKPSNLSLHQVLELEKKNQVIQGWNNTKKLINIFGIASGMAYLHSQNVIHKALKASHVLLDEHFFPKIKLISEIAEISNIGLSVARVFQERENFLYLSPELINGEAFTEKIDVFAFSIILYKIFSKEIKFPLNGMYETIRLISEGERPELSYSIPECYADLIQQCWSQDPGDRPSFEEIVSILKNNKEYITEIGANEEEFTEYVKYVEGEDQGNIFKNFPKVNIDFDQFEKAKKKHFSLKMQQADLSDYEKKEGIGKGAFGKVYKVINKRTGDVLAAKVSIKDVSECNDDELNSLSREIKIISQLSLPSIVKFVGYSPTDFDSDVKPTIITEILSNGSLDGILNNARKGLADENWTETKKLINIYGIAYSMSYLHSLDIIHRDLKPENIFLDDYLYPKLGDFGLSKSLSEKLINEPSIPQFYLKGTYPYIAPEIFDSYSYTKACDVYAYSMIVYEILSGERPFDGFNQFQILSKIPQGYRPEINFPILDCYKELITKCWSQDPNERPTFDEIVRILKESKELITDQVDQNEFFDYIESVGDKIPEMTENKNPKKKAKKVQVKSYKNSKIDEELYMSTLQDKYLNLSKYEKVKMIQKSGIYKIYEVKDKETGKIYAGKFSSIEIDQLTQDEIINLSREVNIISGISHPSFLKFIGYSPYNYRNQQKPVILTEFPSNMTLSKVLQLEREGNHISSWDDTMKLINIYGIASGMEFLHLNQILHRDLNPESIFLDEHLFPKIGNFSFLTKNHTLQSMTYQSTSQIKGNPNYSAPEVLTMNEYSQAGDVYSFGLIVYEIMTNEVPFKDAHNLVNLINDIGKKGKRPIISESVPDCYRELIESCWNKWPEYRPSFEEITAKLTKDERFITSKVNKDNFMTYVENIESFCAEFKTDNKIVDFSTDIEKKGKIVECDDDQINSQQNNNISSKSNLVKIQEDRDIGNDLPNGKQSSDSQDENEEFHKSVKINPQPNITKIQEEIDNDNSRNPEHPSDSQDENEESNKSVKVNLQSNLTKIQEEIDSDNSRNPEQPSDSHEESEDLNKNNKINSQSNLTKIQEEIDNDNSRNPEHPSDSHEESEDLNKNNKINSQPNLTKMQEDNDEPINIHSENISDGQPVSFYKKEAEHGNVEAQKYLANKYITENDTESIYIYICMLIKSKDFTIPFDYAKRLFDLKYYKQAFNYFSLLSQSNHPMSNYFIGIMKFQGLGCNENKDASYQILKHLSDNGIEQATDFLEQNFN